MPIADDWFAGFHTGLAARLWRAVGGLTADEDAGLIMSLIGLPQGASVLDVPCGDGRIAVRLADNGLVVHGIDISREEIEFARAGATERGSSASFEPGDMRALPEARRYDAVVSWGNSFGYLPPAQTEGFLAACHRILEPGGSLAIQIGAVAESSLPRGIADTEEHEFGGIRMLEQNRYDPFRSAVETDYVFRAEGEPEERRSSVQYVHTSGEIVRMLKLAEFRNVELLDADGRAPYGLASPLLIVLATA